MKAASPLLVVLCLPLGCLGPGSNSASSARNGSNCAVLETKADFSVRAACSQAAGMHQVYAVEYDDLASGSLVAARGIRFGQQGVSATFRHGEFAGRTIDEVAAGLRSGAISPNQLTIQTITRDGVEYTLNNRSLMALREAGMEPTIIQNVTGNGFFEQQLTQRLSEMGEG